MIDLRKLIIVLTFCFGTFSCGYSFQGAGSVLPPDIKTIAIPLVQNTSTEAGLSTVFTEALRDRFERFGVFTIVEDAARADAVLNARIISVTQDTRAVTSETDVAVQYDTIFSVSAELRRVGGPVLWRNPGMSVSLPVGATGDVIVATSPDFAAGTIGAGDIAALDPRELTRGQEQEALAFLAEEAARRIYDQAVAPEF